jgi:hypothetical protein
MYCTIHLLEIISLSDFSSPLFYPSLLGDYNIKCGCTQKYQICETEKKQKKTKKNKKKTKKTQKNPLGWFFLKTRVFSNPA